MPKENKTQYALLGMLTYKSMSGYDMKKMSDHSIGYFWNENYGNIYPVLRKMVSEGLVSLTREGGDGGPARKVYSITQKGRETLESWLNRPADRMKLRYELLLKVFFGQWTVPSVIAREIEAEDTQCAAIIEELEGLKAHMEEELPMHGEGPEEQAKFNEAGMPYWKLTVEFGLRYYTGIRRWCADSLKALNQASEAMPTDPYGRTPGQQKKEQQRHGAAAPKREKNKEER